MLPRQSGHSAGELDPEKLKPDRPRDAVLWVLLVTHPNIGEFSFLDGAPGDVDLGSG